MLRLDDEAGAAGFSMVALQTVDSTNRLALDLAQQARANRTWVIADTQRAGRGRQGREWVSPVGNLYTSLLLVSPAPPAQAPKLGFVAGVALIDVLHSAGLSQARLKWPNDVLVGHDKLAGILLEGRTGNDGRQAVAIGIGVNIAKAPLITTGHATSLADQGIKANRDDVFRRLTSRMAHWLSVFDKGEGFARIRTAWEAAAIDHGSILRVNLPSGEISGSYAGINDDGQLRLATSDGERLIAAGDVFLSGESDD